MKLRDDRALQIGNGLTQDDAFTAWIFKRMKDRFPQEWFGFAASISTDLQSVLGRIPVEESLLKATADRCPRFAALWMRFESQNSSPDLLIRFHRADGITTKNAADVSRHPPHLDRVSNCDPVQREANRF